VNPLLWALPWLSSRHSRESIEHYVICSVSFNQFNIIAKSSDPQVTETRKSPDKMGTVSTFATDWANEEINSEVPKSTTFLRSLSGNTKVLPEPQFPEGSSVRIVSQAGLLAFPALSPSHSDINRNSGFDWQSPNNECRTLVGRLMLVSLTIAGGLQWQDRSGFTPEFPGSRKSKILWFNKILRAYYEVKLKHGRKKDTVFRIKPMAKKRTLFYIKKRSTQQTAWFWGKQFI
jgi:hypothetical protein